MIRFKKNLLDIRYASGIKQLFACTSWKEKQNHEL